MSPLPDAPVVKNAGTPKPPRIRIRVLHPRRKRALLGKLRLATQRGSVGRNRNRSKVEEEPSTEVVRRGATIVVALTVLALIAAVVLVAVETDK